MASDSAPSDFDRFELNGWEVDPRALTITRDNDTRRLESKVMELLVYLAARPNEVVTREELEAAVWRDLVVGYRSLTAAVIKLRKAFGDDPRDPKVIETVPKAGYRLIGKVGPIRKGPEGLEPDARPTEGRGRARVRRRLVAGAGAALLLAGVALIVRLLWSPEVAPVRSDQLAFPLPDKPSIAVLPFKNHSQDSEQGFIGDAIAEGITTELARFSELFVIARQSSFVYKRDVIDIRQVAEELGVHYVLVGSHQRDRDRFRVSVQLVDALAGNYIWTERYERNLDELFAVQDEIVRSVASTVGAKVAFNPPPTGGLNRLSALHHNLKARQYIREWTREGTERAKLENLAAIEADPTSAVGHIGLTFVYVRAAAYGWLGLSSDEALAQARQSAEKALELEPDNYDAHFARAVAHSELGEQDLAIVRYMKSIELNPSATNVMASLAEPLVYSGQADDAIELLRRAMRLDPHHPDWFKWSLAWAQWYGGECEAALDTMLAMSRIPNMARRTLAAIYVCLGREKEAAATIDKFLENEPGFSITKERESFERKFKDVAAVDRYIDALRIAGLPEHTPGATDQ